MGESNSSYKKDSGCSLVPQITSDITEESEDDMSSLATGFTA